MMIHEIISSEDYNQWLKCHNTHLNEPTNQISTKFPKVVKLLYNKTFETSVINSSMSPPSLGLTNSSSIITSQEVYLSINDALHPFTLTVSISCVSTDNVSYIIIHRLQPHGCQILWLKSVFSFISSIFSFLSTVSQGGRGYWSVYYTSPQGFIITFFFFDLTKLETFIEHLLVG